MSGVVIECRRVHLNIIEPEQDVYAVASITSSINKQGKADEHKYMDHWIDDSHFHWQSQNATDPSSKRGQEIIRHAALGIDIHLFVRENKLAAGKAAPFTYHGRVVYQSHQGSQPMSVVFGLQSGGA